MLGRVVGLAVKTAHKAPLSTVGEMAITLDGIVGNVPQGARRRITILSREQWERVQLELKGELPWTLRRANVLVEEIELSSLIGRRIRINDVVLQINGETEPCDEMDRYHPGLQPVLRPECRGGVYAGVIVPGTLRVGDRVMPEESGS